MSSTPNFAERKALSSVTRHEPVRVSCHSLRKRSARPRGPARGVIPQTKTEPTRRIVE